MGAGTRFQSIRDWSNSLGERDPARAVVRLAEAIREEYLRRNRKGPTVPVPVGKIASLRRIEEFRIRNISHTGSLIMTKTGFACTLSEGESQGVRKNFAVAHEIGHTEFFDISEWPPRFLIPPELMYSQEVERLCNIFSGALLIPEESLTSIAEALSRRLAFDEIDRLSDKFAVSREVLIHRLQDSQVFANRGECIAILKRPRFPGAHHYSVETLVSPRGDTLVLFETAIPLRADAAVLPASLNNSPVTCRFEVKEYGSRYTSYAVALGQVERL